MAENVTLEKVLIGDTTNEYVDKINKAIDNVNSNADAIDDLTDAVASAGKVDDVKVNDISVVSNKIANVKVNGSTTVNVTTSEKGEITISAPKLAKSLTLSVDTSTYVLTATLRDSNGNILSSPTVDLPLETMVVGASYGESTKEIILTLQNGNTTRFSVADLVSGLVSTDDLATTSKSGLMSSTDKSKLDRIDSSLEGVTADQIGKVKDVKVNGTSVLGSDGVANITIDDLKAGYVSVQSSSLVNCVVDGTTYKAIKVADTDTELEVYNSDGNKILTHTVRKDGFLYICVGTTAINCTLRKINGNSVGSGGSTADGSNATVITFSNSKAIVPKDTFSFENGAYYALSYLAIGSGMNSYLVMSGLYFHVEKNIYNGYADISNINSNSWILSRMGGSGHLPMYLTFDTHYENERATDNWEFVIRDGEGAYNSTYTMGELIIKKLGKTTI